MYRLFGTAGMLVLCVGAAANAQNTTREALAAPRVDTQVKIRLHEKTLQYALDDRDDFNDIEADELFVTSRIVKVTYPHLNPLDIQVSAAVEEVDDPSHAQLVKLVEALLKLPPILRPADTKAGFLQAFRLQGGVCGELMNAERILKNLLTHLYAQEFGHEGLKAAVVGWRDEISKKPDPLNIAEVRQKVSAFRSEHLTKHIDDGEIAIQELEAALAKQAPESSVAVPQVRTRNLQDLPGAVEEIVRYLNADGTGLCPAVARALLEAALLTNPRSRLQEVRQIGKTLDDLYTALAPFANANNWQSDVRGGPRVNYVVVQKLEPSADKMRVVTVKAARLSYDASDVGIVTKKEDAASAKFTVRQHSRFVPEIGAGVVLSDIRRPTYGTTAKDGITVVAAAKNKNESYDAAVMLNFVCRCGWGPQFTPMIQIGASPNVNAPSLLIGGGFRLFTVGKGELAIGIGGILAWVKDLTELRPGDPVTGTKDIEADLTFQRRTRPYVAFLYNF